MLESVSTRKRSVSNQQSSWVVFSYGSNSRSQLRARCENEELETSPAYVENYARVFCLDASTWSGGVASLCPCHGVRTKGSIVRLSHEEKSRLDRFEGGYREIKIEVYEALTDNVYKAVEATVYIAGDCGLDVFTPRMSLAPSEAYLTAIHLHLRSHWPQSAEDALDIRSSASPHQALSYWQHPGVDALSTLEALCVEVNALKRQPWRMPAAIRRFRADLNRIATVFSVEDLAVLLAPPDGNTSSRIDALKATKSSIDSFWSDDTFDALKKLKLHRIFLYGSLMTGLKNHSLIQKRARLVCENVQTSESHFSLVSAGSFPFAFSNVLHQDDNNNNDTWPSFPLKGQLFAVDTHLLKNEMDALEGHPDFYLRSRCTVVSSRHDFSEKKDVVIGSAWIYLLNDSETLSEVIANPASFPRVVDPPGDWRAFLLKKNNADEESRREGSQA